MIWFSPTYSRELYDQYNARVARKGQTEVTRIYRIVCPGTIDDAAGDEAFADADDAPDRTQTEAFLTRIATAIVSHVNAQTALTAERATLLKQAQTLALPEKAKKGPTDANDDDDF